ncbi:peptide chain release factor N(5)-glutamine methyltransferase [Micromonospora sp. C28ISP2-4]|uniref:peptide chain release factor N(5)-glutamine methyltransferase n=1 Tax=Micromonospora sp. C28ISP2-4 TaxID=3059523 RepID=UPI002676E839|nr:peptide chain release factor N(5)-glutamine methyltransferase [Micromonospora sp. C28ISP2-4]MDO3684162.1 peptide chain release factor N(5)-glutamine methyltransferase [Micromonospora sp. C28ISP2-4]
MTALPQHPSEGTERERPSLVINRVERALAAAGVEAPRAEAEQLAAYVLEVPRGRLALADGFTPAQRDRLDALVRRRVTREPLQHLLGSAGFRHLELGVGPGVFVPRPETELLAGWGIERAREYAAPLVVDLCSGSGAIALAVAQEVPAARVVAVERSPAALAWLRRNAAGRAAAGDRPIEVVAADVTDPELLADLAGRVDVLLCNPPYVPRSVTVPPEVAGHDPDEAVFGGADGLDVIRPVVRRAALLLRPGGAIGIEHDDTHAAAVPGLLRVDGRYDRVEEHRDLAGRPRWATASRRADGTHADPAPAWQTDSS